MLPALPPLLRPLLSSVACPFIRSKFQAETEAPGTSRAKTAFFLSLPLHPLRPCHPQLDREATNRFVKPASSKGRHPAPPHRRRRAPQQRCSDGAPTSLQRPGSRRPRPRSWPASRPCCEPSRQPSRPRRPRCRQRRRPRNRPNRCHPLAGGTGSAASPPPQRGRGSCGWGQRSSRCRCAAAGHGASLAGAPQSLSWRYRLDQEWRQAAPTRPPGLPSDLEAAAAANRRLRAARLGRLQPRREAARGGSLGCRWLACRKAALAARRSRSRRAAPPRRLWQPSQRSSCCSQCCPAGPPPARSSSGLSADLPQALTRQAQPMQRTLQQDQSRRKARRLPWRPLWLSASSPPCRGGCRGTCCACCAGSGSTWAYASRCAAASCFAEACFFPLQVSVCSITELACCLFQPAGAPGPHAQAAAPAGQAGGAMAGTSGSSGAPPLPAAAAAGLGEAAAAGQRAAAPPAQPRSRQRCPTGGHSGPAWHQSPAAHSTCSICARHSAGWQGAEPPAVAAGGQLAVPTWHSSLRASRRAGTSSLTGMGGSSSILWLQCAAAGGAQPLCWAGGAWSSESAPGGQRAGNSKLGPPEEPPAVATAHLPAVRCWRAGSGSGRRRSGGPCSLPNGGSRTSSGGHRGGGGCLWLGQQGLECPEVAAANLACRPAPCSCMPAAHHRAQLSC